MSNSPLSDLIGGAMIGGILVVCAVGPARSENRHHLSHYHEERLRQLGQIAFPPLIEGSEQFFDARTGLLMNSNTRERGDDCRQHIGMDGALPILFEHCTGETE